MRTTNRAYGLLAAAKGRGRHSTGLALSFYFLVTCVTAEARAQCDVTMSPASGVIPSGTPITVRADIDEPPDDGHQYSWAGTITLDGATLCTVSVRQYSNGIDTEHDCTKTLSNLNPGVHTLGWSCMGRPSNSGSLNFAVGSSGYVDPKYLVVGVTYAPPGQSASTFVQYVNSTFVGNTQSVANSFGSATSVSASVGAGITIPGVLAGNVTTTVSGMNSQTVKNTSTITTSIQVQDGEKTNGTGSYFAPVDNDYDQIWVWLNPVALFFVGGNYVQWQGYGFDMNDQPGMDIVAIQLGYLNGDFGPMPADLQLSLDRAWAANQTWPAGEGPALTSTDLAQIASADPFSVTNYGSLNIGGDPPSPETPDHRFTMSSCSENSSFDYLQAAPSAAADIYTCTLTYTNTSTEAQDITTISSQTFSVDASFSGKAFLSGLNADLKQSNTLTWTTDEQNSITTTNTSTASLSVQGPPCGNAVSEVGPCVPVYDASGNQPTQFYVYQDNMYGTFMFAPVHYYPNAP